MSQSLTINTPNIVKQNTPLRNVPSGSTAEPDYNVKYVPQSLTEAQQAQARQNIGAAAAGETGGATINEFHYLRDTSTDPATFYIDADGYEPKEGDLMTIVWDWPFRTNENDPDATFKNPATLKNNTTNPSIYIKNAHQMATDYDEIDPEVNTRWTVRLEKVNDVWYAYNISTAVQADWNSSDRNAPSYIKNKPTITTNDIPDEYRGIWKIHFIGSGRRSTTTWTDILSRVLNTWNRGVEKGSSNRRIECGWNAIQFLEDAREHIMNFDMTDNEATSGNILIKTFIGGTVLSYNFNTHRSFTGNVDVFIYPEVIGDNAEWKTWGSATANAHNVKFYCMTNVWPSNWTNIYADVVYVDSDDFKSVSGQTYSVPQSLETPGIWVPNSKKTEYLSFLATTYPDADISVFTNKTIYYDFITWNDDHTPQIITLPTLPLTMTDANNSTISGDFVAQNITITPAS